MNPYSAGRKATNPALRIFLSASSQACIAPIDTGNSPLIRNQEVEPGNCPGPERRSYWKAESSGERPEEADLRG